MAALPAMAAHGLRLVTAALVRHEARLYRMEVRDRHHLAVVAAGEAGGSLSRESPGRVGAASTKSRRSSTTGWGGRGERDGKVYARNRCRYAS